MDRCSWRVVALARLVDKSLALADEGDGDVIRYRFLQTVRQYAVERLTEAGEEAAIRERHATWCLALTEQAEPVLFSGEQIRWLPRLADEHDNFQSALAWLLDADPDARLRFAGYLWQYWRTRGHHREGRRWLERLLEQNAPTPPRVTVLLGLRAMSTEQVDVAPARDWLEAGLTLSRQLDDKRYIRWCLCDLAIALLFLGDVPTGRDLLEEASDLARAIGISAASPTVCYS